MPMRDLSGWLPGVILIAIGVTLFAVQLLNLDGDVIVLVIGLVFAIAYVATRRYGLLIAAGILTGLGTGILLEDFGVLGEPVVLGLGLGFLAIYAGDFLSNGARAPRRWWPLIPGTILALIGADSLVRDTAATDVVARLSPLVLVIAGVIILVAAWRRAPDHAPR